MIDAQPASQQACADVNVVTFSVVAHGDGVLSYQWRRGTTNLTDGGNISGVHTASLTLNPAHLGDAGTDYNVVVSNTLSKTSNNATLTVYSLPATPTGLSASPSTICVGDSSTLSATVNPGETVDWFESTCGGISAGSGTSVSVSPTSTTTYYAQARNTTTGCASTLCASITVTVNSAPIVNAGSPYVGCGTNSVNLSGTASNYSAVNWTTTDGTGTFTNGNTLTAQYNPSPADVTLGVVHLKLTATGNAPCASSDSTTTLTITAPPTASAGGPYDTCDQIPKAITGTVTGQSSVLWTTSGSGAFADATQASTTYTPSPTDIGTIVTLTLTAQPTSPCTVPAVATAQLTVTASPTASAGGPYSTCDQTPKAITGTASGQTSVLWTTSGTGAFADATQLNTTYTPSAGDVGSIVTLTLTAQPTSPCAVPAVANALLTVVKSPTASAGGPYSTCDQTPVGISGTATDQTTVLWTTSGTGAFANASSLSTTYTPSVADIGTIVTLTLTAQPTSPCATPAVANAQLTVVKSPTAAAGGPYTTCDQNPIPIAGTATGQTSVLWTTSGTGTFASSTSLSTTYTPSLTDIGTVVTLTLTAQPTTPCGTPAVANAQLTVVASPTAAAGGPYSTCDQTPVPISGTATGQTSVLWTTSGTGAFGNAAALSTTYTPSLADIGTVVTLTLTAQPTAPCAAPAVAMAQLTVVHSPTATVGGPYVTCDQTPVAISGTASETSGFAWDTPNGTGTFANANALSTTYTPSLADIGQTITLRLTAQGNLPCNVPAVATTPLTVVATPICTITAAVQVSANSTGNIASVASIPGATYAWTISGGSITAGATTNSITFTAGNGASVTLGVSITTALGGCHCTGSLVIPIHSGPGNLVLTLDKSCYKPGDTVVAKLRMTGLQTAAAGFQAFLKFDTATLQWQSTVYNHDPLLPATPNFPFGNVILPGGPSGVGLNFLDLASGIDQFHGQTATLNDSLLVTMTFTVRPSAPDNCSATNLVEYRSHIPPTRLTDAFANELAGLLLTPPAAVVVDGTPPTVTTTSIAACYPDVASAEAAAWAATTIHDNCTPDAQIVKSISTVGTCSAVITITATDCSGNSTVKTYSTHIDNDTPVIDVPATQANLPPIVSQQCGPVPAPDITKVVATDACPITVTSSDSTSPLGCPNHFTVTRTYHVEDQCGHYAEYVQTINVEDTIAPTINPPGPITVSCAAAVPAHDFAGGSASDNCGTPLVTWVNDAISNQTCPNKYTITRTYRATDACGHATDGTQIITVNDNTGPALTKPGDITIQCDESLIPGLPFGTVTGGVGIYYNSTGGENPANQAYLKAQYSATNTHGAAFAFSTTPLTGSGLTWAALFGQVGPPTQFGFDLVLPAPTNNGSILPPVLNAYDNTNNLLAGRALVGPVTWAINDYKGAGSSDGPQDALNDIINSLVRGASPGNPLTHVVITKNVLSHPSTNIWVVDLAGKLVSDSFIHWYNPSTPHTPMGVFNLNGDFYFAGTLTYDTTLDANPLMDFYSGTITISANSPNTALGFATAVDNCDPFPVVTYSDSVVVPNPACPQGKIVTRTWTATDSCGNHTSADQIITVVDSTPPVIHCPANLTVQCATDVPPADFAGGTVSDNCDGAPTVTHEGDVITPAVHCPNQYTITRTYKAVDHCNNQVTCDQIITVHDDIAPTLTKPADTTIACTESTDPSHTGAGTATDNCTPAPTVTYTDVSSVLVNPSNLGNWSLFATQSLSNTPGGDGVANFVNGPATPPLGSGSAHLFTGTDGSQSSQMRNSDWVGTRIADLTVLKYSTYATAWNGSQLPYLTIWVDTDGDLTADDRLWFEPEYSGAAYSPPVVQGPPALNTWQTWDTLKGNWYADSVFGPGTDSRPLSAYLALYPNAKIVNNGALGGIRIASGFASPGDVFNANVDAVIIGTASSATTYNFELGSCSDHTIARTWKAEDACGNVTTGVQTITVKDTVAPTITFCPPSISVNADAGLCTATVNPGTATATDTCDPSPVVSGHRSDNAALNAAYPVGVTTITWTATDACGNSSSCTQTVTVAALNEIVASVELSPTVSSPLSRCITFQVWDCTMTLPVATVDQVLTFVGGKAQNVSLYVPCGSYTCITARDKLHTLRRTLSPMPVNSGKYIADFIAASKPLIGGNLNDDAYIDILDFGVYAGQYNHNYGTGNTTCGTLFPHADISGNGTVFTEDFTFIQINFLRTREANCCGAANLTADGGTPVSSISVAELKARGLTGLVAGDVNNDGVLDKKDLDAWSQGARPGQPLPTTPVRRR